jgi:imidazolonepropionase-like amidohydrolase
VILTPLALLALMTSAAAGQEDPLGGPYDRLVIRGATVIDGTGGPPVGPMDIVIEQGTITALRRVTALDLAEGGARAAGERVIDATGLYVMPGIIDAHTHMGREGLPEDYITKLWLGHGITSVKVFTGGESDPALGIAAAQHGGEDVLAPEVVLYRFWRGDDPRFWDPEGVAEIVAEWAAEGIDGIKIGGKPGLLPDVLPAIVEATRAHGMGVSVHIGGDAVNPMNAVQVAKAGVTTIEHHYGYAESTFTDHDVQATLAPDFDYGAELKRFRASGGVWDETELDQLYGPVSDTLLELSQHGVFTMVPTFSVYEDQTDLARAQNLPWLEDYTMPSVMERWTPNPEVHGSFYFEWTSADEATWSRMFIKWLPWVNDWKNRGGRVAVGSDTGTSYHLYGFGTVRELELMQRAGFHPLEIVRSATQESARAIGREGTGVIRPGYQADLLVMEMNPLEDFKVLYGTGVTRVSLEGESTTLHGLKYTILDGRVLDAGALLEDVAEMVRQAKAAPRTDGGGP